MNNLNSSNKDVNIALIDGLNREKSSKDSVSVGGEISYNITAGPVDYSFILVNRNQARNPCLNFIRHCKKMFADIVPDYIIGRQCCVLFLSLKFHLLKPNYIHERFKNVKKNFRLRLILCLCDIDDNTRILQELTRVSFVNDFTLILCWSSEEVARYIETLKAYESKPLDLIQGRVDQKDYCAVVNDVLTQIQSINKTDVYTLTTSFGSVAEIFLADVDALSACTGLGPKKVQRLVETFNNPFFVGEGEVVTRSSKNSKMQPGPMISFLQSQKVSAVSANANVALSVESTGNKNSPIVLDSDVDSSFNQI